MFDGTAKMTHAVGIRFAIDAVEEAFLIEEKIAAKDVLAMQLFEKITGGDSDLAERLIGMGGFPIGENVASLIEFLRVEMVEAVGELGIGREGG